MTAVHTLPVRTLRTVLAMILRPPHRPRPGIPVAVPSDCLCRAGGLILFLETPK